MIEKSKNLNDIQNYYHKINLIRSKIPFDIDGLVYKIDDILIPENATIVIASIGSFEKIKETLKSNGLKSQKII
jgi:NAD-dependent DNA ligase